MKKRELIDYIQESFNGGSLNPDIYKKAHPLIISGYITMALNTIFYNLFKNNPNGLDIYARWFYEQDVLTSGTMKYTKLPVGLMQLPSGVSSVKEITLTNDDTSSIFTYVKTFQKGIGKRNGSLARMGKTMFTVMDNIVYDNIDPLIKKVNVLMIVPFSYLEDDAEIMIPQGQDEILFNLVLKFVTKKIESDDIIDNN